MADSADKAEVQTQPKRPGAWIFKQKNLVWLHRATLRRQLPGALRLFGIYCAWQPRIGWWRVVGGRALFGLLSRRYRQETGADHLKVDLGRYTLFLNLDDPRMLKVPTEVLDPKGLPAQLAAFVGSGDTFVDVGTNHGSFSVVASGLVGPSGRVVAVEPQPRLAQLVEWALQANAPCPFEVHQIACGDREGEVEFYLPSETSGSAGLFPAFSATPSHSHFLVPLRRFDQLVDWRQWSGRVFLKLDVEGSEFAFLGGAAQCIAHHRPRLMMEIHPLTRRAAGISVEAMGRRLRDLGYQRYIDLEGSGQARPIDQLEWARKHTIVLESDPL